MEVHHKLKTWPVYFELVQDGTKNFELRENDRNFKIGDFLILQEYDPESSTYLGREVKVKIKYMITGPKFGIADGFCVMGFDSLGLSSDLVKSLPNDEEVKAHIDTLPYYGTCTAEYNEGFEYGVKWLKEQLAK